MNADDPNPFWIGEFSESDKCRVCSKLKTQSVFGLFILFLKRVMPEAIYEKHTGADV